MLASAAALVVLIGLIACYERGYAAAAARYEATYREAIDKHRAEQARQRGAEVLEQLRERVRQQANERRLGKASW